MHAKPSYYANRGTLSLAAREIRLVGLGELLARLERRRQLLAAEGLFAPELKRSLPFLPRRVGLVTAPDSAAERDVVENARRRWPAVAFETAYAAMQGTRAAAEVIAAIDRLDRDERVDVIVVARGGGAVEDLLPFSDEGLIRAVAKCSTPLVSAIGHEPDQPLLDLVADVRASTPTDAAKLVVPDVAEELRIVEVGRDRLRTALASWLAREQTLLDTLRSRPAIADPGSLLTARADEVESLRERALRTTRPPPRPGHRRDRPPPRPRPCAVATGDPAPRLRRPPGRRRPRGDLGRPTPARVPPSPSAWPTAACTPRSPTRRSSTRSPMPEDQKIPYEQAREELIEVVRKLEAGGTTLEESLALWERGEHLATICQEWLDGARARLDAARADSDPD